MKMQQKIQVCLLNILILSCYVVTSEYSTHILKSICGTREASDIKHTETTVIKYPWVARIYFIDPTDKQHPKHLGTATIITERHLITAAQVVTPRNTSFTAANLFAVVGGEFEKQGLLYDIQDIFLINVTDEAGIAVLGGLAIVKLMNAMTITKHVRPVCLPRMEDINNDYRNQSLTAVGWSYSSNNSNNALYEVDIPILLDEYCQQCIPGKYPSNKLMCGEDPNVGTYTFDNGGALMRSKDDIFTLVGVEDRGIGRKPACEIPEIPIYFIKLASYMGWITFTIQKSME